MYTDNSYLTKGKYKFHCLRQVPALYLINIYTSKNQTDPNLYAYVEANLDRIKARLNEPEKMKPVPDRCNKIGFHSEKLAKEELNRIKQEEQEHKKPIRVYECSRCGGWHLTSIPYEKWDTELIPAGVLHQIRILPTVMGNSKGTNRDNTKEEETWAIQEEDDLDLPSTPKKPCKRFTYQTEREARHAVHKTERRVLDYQKPVRAFACEKCGFWHLTSVPYSKWEVHHKRPVALNQIILHVMGEQFG